MNPDTVHFWLSLFNRNRWRLSSVPPRSWRRHVLIATWAIFFFLMTSPFTFMLMGLDPVAGSQRNMVSDRRAEGSQLLLYGLRYAVLCLVLLIVISRYRAMGRLLPRLVPLLGFALWAALSLAWSDSPQSTAHGVAALLPLLIVGYGAAVRMPPEDCALSLLLSGVLMALASLFFVFFLPMQGMHQHADSAQSVHAGAWRGIYLHKNHLGQCAALYAAGAIVAGPRVVRNLLVKWGMAGLFLLIVVGSRSASAIALIPLAVVAAWAVVCLNPLQKAMAALYAVAGAIVLVLTVNMILGWLGRDMSLTGRDVIWSIAADFILAHPLHGYGYMSTSYGGFSYAVSHVVNVFDPHNAYIDTLLGTGIIGLLLLLLPAVMGLAIARRSYLQGGGQAQAALVQMAMLAAWLTSCMTESNARPLATVSALGLMTMSLLLSSCGGNYRRRGRRRVIWGPAPAIGEGPAEDADMALAPQPPAGRVLD